MKIERTRLLTLLVVVLVLLNLTTLATIWFRKSPQQLDADRREGPKNFIIQKLHFNEKQIEEFSALVDEHRTQMQELREQIAESKEQFYDQLKSDAPDTAMAYQQIASITQFEEQAERITFNHFKKVRAICSSEQKQEFDVVINEILRRMMGPSHGPHQGPPPMHPPGGPPCNE